MAAKDERDEIKAIFAAMAGPAREAASAPPTGDAPASGPPTPDSPPNPPPRVVRGLHLLDGIDARAWEHPADRAALHGLRRLPGFDQVVRKVFGFASERSLRLLYLANAVKVGPRQYRRVWQAYLDCLAVLDVPGAPGEPAGEGAGEAGTHAPGAAAPSAVPELFVTQTPIVNAGAIGVDHPFIVLNSATVDLLDDDELRFVIGHELGHVRSGHALYKTMLAVILRFTLLRVSAMAGLATLGLTLALREWSRKSELSADRAGLLCLQDPAAAFRVQMKMAGGRHLDQMDVEAFIAQAEEYERGGDLRDSALKLLHLLGQSHPFPALRLVALKAWVDDGSYAQVLAGDYVRRDNPTPPGTVHTDLTATADHYRKAARESAGGEVGRFFSTVGNDLSEAGSALWGGLRDLFRSKPGEATDADPEAAAEAAEEAAAEAAAHAAAEAELRAAAGDADEPQG